MKNFLYGTAYYPALQTPDEVNRDLNYMDSYNFNIIRTAEMLTSWDVIEYEEGKFDFENLDNFMDLCQKHNKKVILGTGSACPPYWMEKHDANMGMVDELNHVYPELASYPRICFNNPIYLKYLKNYISVIANRYKDHPALYGYQIHNEIGYPFMPLSGNELRRYCYCEHCVKGFTEWTKKKYGGDINKLNKAYQWITDSRRLTDFSQVRPSRATPISWSSITIWLDYRLYMMDVVTGFIKLQHDELKAITPDKVTAINTFCLKSQDKLGVLNAIDQFELAKVVDVMGYDLYPGSGDKLEHKPEFSSMFMDHMRSVCLPEKKDMWLLEQESGPIGGWSQGPDRNTSSDDIVRYNMEVIGHGVKMESYFSFNEFGWIPLLWGGMIDQNGNEKVLTNGVKTVGEFLERNDSFFEHSNTKKGEVALLISKESAILANGMGVEDTMVNAWKGAYRIFWEANYVVDFVTPELIQNGYANDYKMIAAPYMLCLDEQTINALEAYVANGGILVGQPRMGYQDERGWSNKQFPTGKLADVFGVNVLDITSKVTPDITYRGKNYVGEWHKENLDVKGAKVIARFFDDKPAVTINNYKKGKAVYCATQGDIAYVKGSHILSDVIKDVLQKDNILPRVELEYSNKMNNEIDAHVLYGKDSDMLIITVYNARNRKPLFTNGKKIVNATLRIGDIKEIISAVDGKAIDFECENGVANFELEIRKDEVLAFLLKK